MPIVARPTTPISCSGILQPYSPAGRRRAQRQPQVSSAPIAFPDWGATEGRDMEIDRRRVRRLIEKSRTQERVLNRVIRGQAWLDPVAEAVQKAVGEFYGALGAPGRSIKNVMHGTTLLGHPLHPALTDV